MLVELPVQDKQADSIDLRWMDLFFNSKQDNLTIIEKTRKQLLHLGKVYGLTHPKTIQCSQQLDILINLSMKEQAI